MDWNQKQISMQLTLQSHEYDSGNITPIGFCLTINQIVFPFLYLHIAER